MLLSLICFALVSRTVLALQHAEVSRVISLGECACGDAVTTCAQQLWRAGV